MSRILLSFLFLLTSLSMVQASTFRFEFDITASDLRFGSLDRTVEPIGPVSREDPLYDRAVSQLHSLRSIKGLTGQQVVEVTASLPDGTPGAINCIYGFVCPFLSPTSFVGAGPQGFINGNVGFEWDLSFDASGAGEFEFFDDGGFTGGGSVDGVTYFFVGPAATFQVENASVTNLSEVPLPASGLLLFMGVLALARRKKV